MKLFYNKSVHENAAYYYELAKQTKQKIAGVEEAIKQTEKEMEKAKKVKKKEVRIKKEKQWFEKFHNSRTSEGKLMIGGRNAQQNDIAVSRYMVDNDMFFHADIQGGSVVVLKDGLDAPEGELQEAAQFAACFSKAWANANAAVDVYAVKKEQLSKHASGGFVPTGAFAITGERIWFRSTRLALRIGMGEIGLQLVPNLSSTRLKDELVLVPAKTGKEKGALAKSLAKRFRVHPDDLLEVLPNGKTKTIQK
jgi:predicted ribosome quality control (RQC) complex YloA/Tae2 family protein